jgi:SAM-dependent methyltransferase
MADSVWGKLAGVLFGRGRGHVAVHTDSELLARTDEFNRNAEAYWLAVGSQPTGRQHILNRPLSGRTAPVDVYRVGLMLSELRLGPGIEVLDFGAGSCWLSAFFNRMGCRTISVDVSQAALDLGRELFAMDARQRADLEPEFRVYDGRRLPMDDACVDRIACFDAFHHVPNQQELLAEMFRVLRPGGRAVLAEPGEGHSHAETSVFDEQVFDVLENDFDVLEVEARARAAGFSDVRLKPYLDVEVETLRPSDYVRLGGLRSMLDAGALGAGVGLAQSLRGSFRSCAIMVLSKGVEVRDSRSPGRLRAAITLIDPRAPLRGLARTAVQARVLLENTGDTVWRHGAAHVPGNVELGAHLLTPAGHPVEIDYVRAPLPQDVAPGEAVEIAVGVRFPDAAGSYVLRLDPVAEEIAWFNQVASPFLDVPIESIATEDDRAYRAMISVAQDPPSLRLPAGSRLPLQLHLENQGIALWAWAAQPGPGALRLGAQLLDEAGNLVDLDYARAELPRVVSPGEACDITLPLRLPPSARRFRIKLDVVQERVCWFEQRGSEPLVIEVETSDARTDSAAPGVLRAELRLETPPGPVRLAAGGSIPIRLRATNRGNTRWLRSEDGARGQVRLGARLLSDGGTRDYWRASLAADVEPGASTEIVGELPAPTEPGAYTVVLDLVDEGFAWFQDEGSPVASFDLEVREG